MKYALPAFLLSTAYSTGAAMAHEGHAAAANGTAHWLGQADHLVVVGLGVLAVAIVARLVQDATRRTRQKQ